VYNQFLYNEQTYNGPHTLHVALLFDSTILNEILSPLDVEKLLQDTANLSENVTWDVSVILSDITFLDENFTKQITNKGLFDSIRLNDWVSVKKILSDPWSD
jgi:hypothetical protein